MSVASRWKALSKQEETHRWPVFLPDGEHFLFWDGNFSNSQDDRFSGIYVSSLRGRQKKLVVLCRSSFGYDSGRLFYAGDQRQLISVAFSPSDGTVFGGTSVLANVVGFQPSTYWTNFTVADIGTVVYNSTAGASLSVLTWMDRSGKELGRVGQPAVQFNPMLSPDGGRLAVDISDQKANNVDVWLESTTGAGNSRFTFNPEEEVAGVWSRDGKTIAYRSNIDQGGVALLLKPATGLEREKQLAQAPGTDDFVPNSWSTDDRQILCTHFTSSGSYLELVSVADERKTRLLSIKGSEH